MTMRRKLFEYVEISETGRERVREKRDRGDGGWALFGRIKHCVNCVRQTEKIKIGKWWGPG